MSKIVSEAELFREFIEADTIKWCDWRGKSSAVSVRSVLVEDCDEPEIGTLIERTILHEVDSQLTNDSLDFLASEFEYMAGQLRLVSQYFDGLKKERKLQSDDGAEEDWYRSLTDVKRDQVGEEAA